MTLVLGEGDGDEVEERWFFRAKDAIFDSAPQVDLEAEAHDRLRRLIREGVQELIFSADAQRGQWATDESSVADPTMEQAERNLVFLARVIAAETERRGSDFIDATVVEAVTMKLCPIWPFCR